MAGEAIQAALNELFRRAPRPGAPIQRPKPRPAPPTVQMVKPSAGAIQVAGFGQLTPEERKLAEDTPESRLEQEVERTKRLGEARFEGGAQQREFDVEKQLGREDRQRTFTAERDKFLRDHPTAAQLQNIALRQKREKRLGAAASAKTAKGAREQEAELRGLSDVILDDDPTMTPSDARLLAQDMQDAGFNGKSLKAEIRKQKAGAATAARADKKLALSQKREARLAKGKPEKAAKPKRFKPRDPVTQEAQFALNVVATDPSRTVEIIGVALQELEVDNSDQDALDVLRELKGRIPDNLKRSISEKALGLIGL